MRSSPSVPRTFFDGTPLWVDSRPRAAAQRRFEAAVLIVLAAQQGEQQRVTTPAVAAPGSMIGRLKGMLPGRS